MAGDEFFPPNYKTFPFSEGDFLASQDEGGTWGVQRVLKVDKVVIKKGKEISIMGQHFTAPFDDYLLVISVASIGKSDKSESDEETSIQMAENFESLDELTVAISDHSWITGIGHMPIRTDGIEESAIVIANKAVTKEELEGYSVWKKAFDAGEAGIF